MTSNYGWTFLRIGVGLAILSLDRHGLKIQSQMMTKMCYIGVPRSTPARADSFAERLAEKFTYGLHAIPAIGAGDVITRYSRSVARFEIWSGSVPLASGAVGSCLQQLERRQWAHQRAGVVEECTRHVVAAFEVLGWQVAGLGGDGG